MVRTASPATTRQASASVKKSGGRRKTATAELDALQSKKTAVRNEFGKGKRTKAAYKGYITRGRKILADIIKERKAKEKTGWKCPEGINTALFAKAFDGTPNKYSAMALELYITQKCLVEERGKSTADGIHGAWAEIWDNLPGGKYAGPYHYDEETDTVTGCPARAPEIEGLMKCIKNKSRVKGEAATRRHAEATTIEDMRKIIAWSESQCSAEELKKFEPKDVEALLLSLKHGMVRAFLASGYSLWTRNFELCQLQERDLTPDAQGPAPYYLPFIGVFLDNRKGWQTKQGYDGPLKSNHYDIYEQKDTPEICMFTHLSAWRAIYRQRLGRDFEPDDYVFPYIAPNGVIHPKKPMSHDLVQDYINEFASGAKVDKIFTTHCLRRGGSQYRFMFAPIGKRWSLSIIRWWGGWAEGEQVDTLMRYLMDSLQSYESGHGDALNPHRLEADKSFMGDSDALKPPTVAEFRLLSEKILTNLDSFSAHLRSTSIQNAQPQATASVAAAFDLMSLTRQTPPAGHTQAAPTARNTSSLIPPAPAIASYLPSREPASMEVDTAERAIPIAGVVIPSVGRDAKSWRRAVEQWESGDPSVGLMPLKDWPAHYYTGTMRPVTGTLYSNRKLLAMEYKRLGSSDEAFMKQYPEHTNITKLLAAIRQSSGRTRRRATVE